MKLRVLSTARRGLSSVGGDGVDKGLPDIFCRADWWPRGMWLGLEIKTDTGRLSSEQEALEVGGAIVVVRGMAGVENLPQLIHLVSDSIRAGVSLPLG